MGDIAEKPLETHPIKLTFKGGLIRKGEILRGFSMGRSRFGIIMRELIDSGDFPEYVPYVRKKELPLGIVKKLVSKVWGDEIKVEYFR